MKKSFVCQLVFLSLALAAGAEESLPQTFMTQRGRLVLSEDFDKPLAASTGVAKGFASGFSGWRFNQNPKAGRWEQNGGHFAGIELVESHHPATASYGMTFQDAIIQCDVRLDGVPADGRKYRNVFLKLTDEKDYVIQVSVGPGGLFLTPYDASRLNTTSKQRERGKSAIVKFPVKQDEWHTLVVEVRGEEVVGTLDGRSVTLSSPLIGASKHSIMIGAGTQGSFRRFRVWEAQAHPDWSENKTRLLASAQQRSLQEAFHSDKLAALDAEIARAVKDGLLVGASLWLEHRGQSHHRAFGHRALQPAMEAMTEDTVFDLASVTKAVAAASAAMLCVERGMLQLDEPVSKHLPEFTGDGREKITPRHLLLHSSGLQVNLNGTKPPFSRTPAEAYAQACRERPRFEPGSAFSYSSVGSMVLGMLIEKVSGQAFDAFCSAEIFRPLKMNDTLFRPSGSVLERVSPSSAARSGLVDDIVAREMGGVSGHASLFSTSSDLARFARMMLHGGELDGARVFKPETIRLMTSVQSPADLRSPDAKNLPVRRALGWDIDTPYRTPPHDYSLVVPCFPSAAMVTRAGQGRCSG